LGSRRFLDSIEEAKNKQTLDSRPAGFEVLRKLGTKICISRLLAGEHRFVRSDDKQWVTRSSATGNTNNR